MFHVIWVVCDVFDHVLEQVVARKYGVELARLVITLQKERRFKVADMPLCTAAAAASRHY